MRDSDDDGPGFPPTLPVCSFKATSGRNGSPGSPLEPRDSV